MVAPKKQLRGIILVIATHKTGNVGAKAPLRVLLLFAVSSMRCSDQLAAASNLKSASAMAVIASITTGTLKAMQAS